MRKFILVLPLALGLGLGACTTQQSDDTYAVACSAVSLADAGFQIYASTGKVSQSIMDNERLAVVGAQAICDGPRPTNTATSLAAVTRALTAIATATSKARTQVRA